ncbi:hypothetical protein AUR04nite_24330 [Glutamicibacter uratoxydans]|uniref:Major facilitator superfamily (MFS) profile domain-containing protein n=1 Tax=Glutamicibacter uratoxydans TaxID=43667 RepID=A0A4Y4DWX5_GLUUR|nr:MFS transporter [Glutamicibacter uratoxydans]GED06901.1 hypothetical protein AUR04nite_24330 [Glutamicibacter uratoxydans]
MSNTRVNPSLALPSERRIVAAVWPALLASALGLLPFTLLSTFLIPIAQWTGAGVAEIGSLRGLAGIGAVIVGVVLAPLIGRILPGRVAAAALVLMGLAAIIGTFSGTWALAIFCLATGMSNALLYPALSTAAADRFGEGPAAGRAATLVMTAQTLASTAGAPLLVLPAMWWSWQGNLIAIAIAAFALAPALLRFGRQSTQLGSPKPPLKYVAAFKALSRIRGARALLLVSFGRAGAFMGHLAFLAPLYAEKFHLSTGWFAFVWSLSGGSFFLGHLLAGRMLNTEGTSPRPRMWMVACLGTSLGALLCVYFSPVLPLALAGTAVLSASHAVVAAAVTTLLVQRCSDVRGTALSLNAAGMSLGLFLGTAACGAALAAAGYPAACAVLVGFTVLALIAALNIGSSPSEPAGQTS